MSHLRKLSYGRLKKKNFLLNKYEIFFIDEENRDRSTENIISMLCRINPYYVESTICLNSISIIYYLTLKLQNLELIFLI